VRRSGSRAHGPGSPRKPMTRCAVPPRHPAPPPSGCRPPWQSSRRRSLGHFSRASAGLPLHAARPPPASRIVEARRAEPAGRTSTDRCRLPAGPSQTCFPRPRPAFGGGQGWRAARLAASARVREQALRARQAFEDPQPPAGGQRHPISAATACRAAASSGAGTGRKRW
jgi:hypothetical protein